MRVYGEEGAQGDPREPRTGMIPIFGRPIARMDGLVMCDETGLRGGECTREAEVRDTNGQQIIYTENGPVGLDLRCEV